MTNEQNNSTTCKAEVKQGFVKGESFVEYIKRRYGLKQGNKSEDLLDQIIKNAQFCELLGYLKWRNSDVSGLAKRHLLAPLLQHVLLPGNESSYDYIIRSRAQKQEDLDSVRKLEFSPKRQSIVKRRTCIYIFDPGYLDSLLGILNDFLVHCVVDHLEDQIVNGKGERKRDDREITGMLGLGYEYVGKGDLLEICMDAVEKFYKNVKRPPTAIVMSFPQKLHLMKILSEKTPGILATTYAAFHSQIGTIPIVLSDFMPEDRIMLVNFDSVYLISGERDNILNVASHMHRMDIAYNYWCNVVEKEANSIMTVILPESGPKINCD